MHYAKKYSSIITSSSMLTKFHCKNEIEIKGEKYANKLEIKEEVYRKAQVLLGSENKS